MVKVTTTTLLQHHAWLGAHAETKKDGRLFCQKTGGDINAQVAHRYRLDPQGPDAPYVDEMLLPEVTGSEGGSMVSFTTFSCPHCNDRPEIPKEVRGIDLVRLHDGAVT